MALDRRQALQQLGLLGTTALLGGSVAAADNADWKLATFQLDVTPPVGHPLLGISFAPSTSILDPLEARGFVLTGPAPALVLISIDWCEVRNDAFHRWRNVLAAAAGTTPERVLVHTIHQHDTPYFDLTAQKLLDASQPGGRMLDPAFHEDCVQRAAAALKESLSSAVRVNQIGVGQAKIEKLASSRRVDESGKVSHRRYSRCTDSVLQALPDGQIDPWLKTISFWNDTQPLLALSVYACHPMSYYGGGEISGDFPNMARKRRDASEPRLFQIYASGCCGDVTAGKYNDGSKGNRLLFADRLAGGMAEAWANTKRHPLREIYFRNEPMILPHSELPSLTEAVLMEKLNNSAIPIGTRAQIAMGLSNLKHHADGHHIDVPLIDFGPAQLVLLPAESFVAYQLFAQQQRPDGFVVTLGFGESAPGYIPTNQAFKEGFREEHGYTWNRPGAEDVIQATLKKLLAR